MEVRKYIPVLEVLNGEKIGRAGLEAGEPVTRVRDKTPKAGLRGSLHPHTGTIALLGPQGLKKEVETLTYLTVFPPSALIHRAGCQLG